MKAPDIISDTKKNKQQQNKLTEKIKSTEIKTMSSSSNNLLSTNTSSMLTSDKLSYEEFLQKHQINVLKCNNQIKELHTVLRDR